MKALIRTQSSRRLLACLLLIVLVLPVLQPWSNLQVRARDEGTIGDAPVWTDDDSSQVITDDVQAAGAGVSVDVSSRAAVVAFYNSEVVNAPEPAANWTGNVASCKPGTTSSSYKQAVLKRINYYRAMAGVPTNTVINSTKSSKAQQAALMMSARPGLSHSPTSDWKCYTADGRTAAGNSNLALGNSGWDAIDAYMLDDGSNNTAAGHRRWILMPQVHAFGTGDIPVDFNTGWPANALWVFEESDVLFGTRPATRDTFVAWPPAGYVPYQVVYPRWSFTYPGASFQSATVTVKQGSTTIPVTIEYRSSAGLMAPENSIVFRISSMGSSDSWPKPNGDKPYTVEVKNVSVGGSPRNFSYTVTVIDPAATPGPTPTATTVVAPRPSCTVSPTSGIVRTNVTLSCTKFVPGETVTAHWDNTTTAVLASVVASSAGKATLTFKIPNSTSGPHDAVAKGGTGGRTARDEVEVKPGITLSPTSGGVGSNVEVTLRGFGKSEVITILFFETSSRTNTLTSSFKVSSTGTGVFQFSVPAAYVGSHKVKATGNAGSSAEATYRITAGSSSINPTRTPTATRTAVPKTQVPTETSTPTPTQTAAPPSSTPEPTLPPTETAPTETITTPEVTETGG